MKQYRAAVALVLTLAGLIGLAYWDEWQSKRDESAKETERRAVSISVSDVQNIVYADRNTGVAVTIDRGENGAWRIVQPVSVAADATAVDSFLKTLSEYKYEKVVADNKDRWKDFGVDQPQRTVSLTSKDGSVVNIYVGSQAPVGYGAYFRLDDSGKVYIGSQYLITSTGKTLKEFRDRVISKVSATDVKELRYLVGGEQILLATKKDDRFSIVEPAIADTDHAEIVDFIAEVGRTKADDFNDQPTAEFLAAFKASKAAVEFRWRTVADQDHSFRVAAVKDDFWVQVDQAPTFYKITVDTMKLLKRELFSFRQRQLAELDPNDVSSVSIDGKTFEKRNGDFYSVGGSDEASEKKVFVQNLLSDLAWVKAEEFVNAGSPAATVMKEKAPEHIVSMTFDAKKARDPLVLKIWPHPALPSKTVIEVSGKAAGYVVGKDVLTNLKETQPDAKSIGDGSESLEVPEDKG